MKVAALESENYVNEMQPGFKTIKIFRCMRLKRDLLIQDYGLGYCCMNTECTAVPSIHPQGS